MNHQGGCTAQCQFASTSTVCQPQAGECDVAESCTGSSAACPADAKSTAVCRGSAGACDVAESCDGTSNTCPADGLAPTGTICWEATGECDVAEACTGTTVGCPSDAFKPQGADCVDDSNACTQNICTHTGQCNHPPAPSACGNGCLDSGEQCDDGGTIGGDGCSDTCQDETPPSQDPCVAIPFSQNCKVNGVANQPGMGTGSNDLIVGSAGNDVILEGGGKDTLRGQGGKIPSEAKVGMICSVVVRATIYSLAQRAMISESVREEITTSMEGLAMIPD